jgi:AcrR family transcriptional regulator
VTYDQKLNLVIGHVVIDPRGDMADGSVSKQQERAERILDAAAELVLRWGYKRVTIEEVAKRAAIGKGTIYLHWKTREALFMAVIARELVTFHGQAIAAIRDDPAEILIHRMMRGTCLRLQRFPLLHALFTRDTEVLGDLINDGSVELLRRRKSAFFQEYCGELRTHGLLRADMPLDAQLYAINAATFGFYVLDPLLPPAARLPPEERAEIIARTVRNAFEPPGPPDPAVLRALAPAVIAGLERLRGDYARFAQGSPAGAREITKE